MIFFINAIFKTSPLGPQVRQSQSNVDYINARPDDNYRVHRQTSSLDNLGGGYLLKRNNPFDVLGGGYLLGKRSRQGQQQRGAALDSLGGGYLL